MADVVWSLLFRRSHVDGPGNFERVGEPLRTAREAQDELASWLHGSPSHGDLAVVSGGRRERGYVFDSDSSSFVEWPRLPRAAVGDPLGWLDRWEDRSAAWSPYVMISSCRGLRPLRIAAAAVECAALLAGQLEGDARMVFDVAIRTARMELSRGVQDRTFEAAYGQALRWQTGRRQRYAQLALMASAQALDGARSARAGVPPWTASSSCLESASSAARYARSASRGAASSAPSEDDLRRAVRWHAPLPAVLCAALGLRDPMPSGWVRDAMPAGGGCA